MDFKPITILTGANSSGKSSFVKSMILMKSYLEAVEKEFAQEKPAAAQLDFTKPELKLSGFKDVLNNKCGEDQGMSFTIATTSAFAPFNNLKVEYSFIVSPFEDSKGELEKICLLDNGKSFYELKAENGHLRSASYNYKGFLLDAFLYFAKGIIYNWSMRGSKDKAVIRDGEDITDWKNCFNPEAVPISSDFWKAVRDSDYYVHLVTAIKRYEKTGIIFYFPFFDVIRNNPKQYSKEHVLTVLRSIKGEESLKQRVISSFSSAQEESFLDYFKRLEDSELLSYIKKDNNDSYLVGGEVGYLIDGVDHLNYRDFRVKVENEFQAALRLMYILQIQENKASNAFIENKVDMGGDYVSDHRLIREYNYYLSLAVHDLIFPTSFKRMEIAGNSFTPVQRMYSYEDRSVFIDTIRRYKSLSRTILQNAITPEIKKEQDKARQAFESEGKSIEANLFLVP